MKKVLVSMLVMLMMISFWGCGQKKSEDFYKKYSAELEIYQDKMDKVKSQVEYDALLSEIKPVFAEMDKEYSSEFKSAAMEVYAKFAGLAGEYGKAADAYIMLIENKGELTSDSLLLPAAMACFYAERPGKGATLMKESLKFGDKGDLRLKDYMLAMALEEIMNSEGKDAADSFIKNVKANITVPLTRFEGQAKAIAIFGSDAPELINVEKWLNIKKLTPKSLKGKVYLIDFWATWCNPCRMSTPKMKELYTKYKNNKDFYLIGMTTTYGNYRDGEQNIPNVTPEKERELIAAYVSHKGMEYPIGIAKSNINSQNFGVSGIPAFYLMGKDGKIKKRWVGFVEKNFAEMDELIAAELGKQI